MEHLEVYTCPKKVGSSFESKIDQRGKFSREFGDGFINI